jgi:shikimate kinase
LNLYLIGYRCTGKTTVGGLMAEKTGREFIDADEFLQEQAGRSIQEIFETDGQDAFRELEADCLKKLADRHSLVVGTGGGVILREENREILKSGLVVLLNADAETICHRMLTDDATEGQRPGLTEKGPYDEIAEVLQERQPLYEAAADVVLDTVTLSPEESAEKIDELLRKTELA